MADTRTFLAGLAAGAIGGLLAKRLTVQPRRMPYLDIGQQVLAETRGPVQAALLAARVQARYDELYAHRLRFDQPALRQHYEEGIMPSLALYQTLREEYNNQEAALKEMDILIPAMLERSGRRRLVQILGCLPDPFTVLRVLNRWAIKERYPREGWRFEWVEDSDQCIAYDARECFYLNVPIVSNTARGVSRSNLNTVPAPVASSYCSTVSFRPPEARRRTLQVPFFVASV